MHITYYSTITIDLQYDYVTIKIAIATYRIAGNFRGRKLSWIGESDHFAGKTFAEC